MLLIAATAVADAVVLKKHNMSANYAYAAEPVKNRAATAFATTTNQTLLVGLFTLLSCPWAGYYCYLELGSSSAAATVPMSLADLAHLSII